MLGKRQKTVVALGYFDSVHIGHVAVINKAKQTATSFNAKALVFTFDDGLKCALGQAGATYVYSKSEREEIYKSLGVDQIFFAPCSKEFLNLSKTSFLDFLNERYDIVAYVCGEDYRFGKNGEGDVNFLSEYAINNSQQIFVTPVVKLNGIKISSTLVKQLLAEGKVKQANEMLCKKYSVTGKVFEDRKVGSSIGFPTVNIQTEKGKQQLKNGVYSGSVEIDGINYRAIINYGARPTFNLSEKLIEAHVIDYNGNLYGKELTIYFDTFIRDIKKFEGVEELAKQLTEDLRNTKGGKYD